MLLRDYEESKASMEVFRQDSGREAFTPARERYNKIGEWRKEGDVFVMEFDDLININIDKLDALQTYLFGVVKYDSRSKMQEALDKDSLTKSSARRAQG